MGQACPRVQAKKKGNPKDSSHEIGRNNPRKRAASYFTWTLATLINPSPPRRRRLHSPPLPPPIPIPSTQIAAAAFASDGRTAPSTAHVSGDLQV
uniref:Uncharacterized protein n=1 Tax=Oryza glumipatula TaxID=40148 RepID=A0A0D9Y2K5_9ORYZ